MVTHTVEAKLLQGSHWIGGEWKSNGTTRESVDPASGMVIGQYSLATLDDVHRAVTAAKKAFHSTIWKDDRLLRARVLNRLADSFEQRAEELANLLALENGKVLPHARLEIGIVPQTLRFNAALALTDYGRTAQVVPGSLSVVIKQAAGVAGVIAP